MADLHPSAAGGKYVYTSMLREPVPRRVECDHVSVDESSYSTVIPGKGYMNRLFAGSCGLWTIASNGMQRRYHLSTSRQELETLMRAMDRALDIFDTVDAGLASPFYKRDRAQYSTLVRSQQSRIIDVKRHMWARHRSQFEDTCWEHWLEGDVDDVADQAGANVLRASDRTAGGTRIPNGTTWRDRRTRTGRPDLFFKISHTKRPIEITRLMEKLPTTYQPLHRARWVYR